MSVRDRRKYMVLSYLYKLSKLINTRVLYGLNNTVAIVYHWLILYYCLITEISNTINFYQQNSAIIMIIITITSSISNHSHKDVLTQTNELLRIEFHKYFLRFILILKKRLLSYSWCKMWSNISWSYTHNRSILYNKTEKI